MHPALSFFERMDALKSSDTLAFWLFVTAFPSELVVFVIPVLVVDEVVPRHIYWTMICSELTIEIVLSWEAIWILMSHSSNLLQNHFSRMLLVELHELPFIDKFYLKIQSFYRCAVFLGTFSIYQSVEDRLYYWDHTGMYRVRANVFEPYIALYLCSK